MAPPTGVEHLMGLGFLSSSPKGLNVEGLVWALPTRSKCPERAFIKRRLQVRFHFAATLTFLVLSAE